MPKAVIVQAKRTPIGKVGGILKDIPPEHLVAEVMKHIVDECELNPAEIDDVILGNVVGPGGNIARLSSLTAGFPVEVPGVTVDRQCGSGLEAINMAVRLIQSGAGDVYFAGGVESTSQAPWKMAKPLSLYSQKEPHIFMRARFSPDEIGDPEMGEAAENVAETYAIAREEQDQFAVTSHEKANHSIQHGLFEEEIVPVPATPQSKLLLAEDEGPRANISLRALSRMRPVFREKGTVTAGNACGINDGAAAVLLMSEEKAKSLGLQPLLTVRDSVSVGVDPNLLGIGPVPAVHKLLKRNNLNVSDIDLLEFNEAFASQVIASLKELHIPWDKVNLGGGAIALGHPYGASGAVLVSRLCREMNRKNVKMGVATLGIGGGLGLATLFEREID